jgi:hypothetical protein
MPFSNVDHQKLKMAVGGHFHFGNGYNVSRIKDNTALNKITPV